MGQKKIRRRSIVLHCQPTISHQVAARHARSRRSDAPKQNETLVRRRSTIPQIARTGRQSRRPRRLWNTPRAFNYRPTSCHHSTTSAQCWTSFNGLLRWSECRLHHQRIKTQQVYDGSRRRCSRQLWAHDWVSTCSVYILARRGVRASRHAWTISRHARVIPRFACCGVRAFSHVAHIDEIDMSGLDEVDNRDTMAL